MTKERTHNVSDIYLSTCTNLSAYSKDANNMIWMVKIRMEWKHAEKLIN